MSKTFRTEKPEKGNPYFNTIANGGYSRAIKGSPTDPDCDVLHNCVGAAVGCFHEALGRKEMDLIDPVNAENIFQNAIDHGLSVGQTPVPGALIVWQKGATLSPGDGAGHVAFVASAEDDGTIITAESGWNAKNAWWTTVRKPPYTYAAGYKLLGFVYPPKSNPYPAPTRVIRKGALGADVKWLQWELAERGYLRKSELDGSFWSITLGALLAFQLENGLDVDGICGPATQAALTV